MRLIVLTAFRVPFENKTSSITPSSPRSLTRYLLIVGFRADYYMVLCCEFVMLTEAKFLAEGLPTFMRSGRLLMS